MKSNVKQRLLWAISLIVVLLLVLSGCNLGAAPEQESQLTEQATTSETVSANATTTTQPQGGVTVFPTLTPFVFSTRPAIIPTSIVLVPNQPPPPTSTSAPISIVIVSPLPGNIVSGTVQVVGSASHPNFLQYRLEYGPDPNPNNLWFSLTGVVQQQVLAGTLGVWPTNTGATPDGYYQLRLRVFLRDGTQQQTQVGAIRVQNSQPTPFPTNTTVPRPIASFTQDVANGTAPLVVRFSDRSQGQISSYAWSFGDGGSSNSQNPTYTFRTAGTYTVTLSVNGPGGSSNVSRQIVVNSPQAPIASFTSNTSSGTAPLSVTFTNTSQGQISTYEWDFGDNTESSERSPVHVFNDVGTYNVILRVVGSGGSSTMVRQITVENPAIPAPVANFNPDPANVETGQAIAFNNSTTGEVNTFLWDFNGDGVTDNTDISPTHIYPTAGTYQVRLIAIGPGGQSQSVKEVVVTDPPNAPTAGFTANPVSGIAPLTVNFTNTTTGDVSSYAWDFNGDNVADSTETNPSFAFQSAGTYVVKLTATGAGGSTSTTVTISVDSPPAPPTAAFSASPESGEAPLLVQFTNQSSGSQLTYSWDFNGDGTTDSTEQSPSFNFDSAAQYNVTLTVTDPQNQTDSASLQVDVTAPVIPAPVANFSFNPNGGQAPVTIQFTNETTGDVSAYAWDFNGDGLADNTTENPSFEFTAGGTFTVTLTVTGAGGSNSTSRDVVITDALAAPTAGFSTDTTSITVGQSVTFTDASSGTVDSYSWDFNGDGTEDATGLGPHSFAFNSEGTFTPTLTVANAAGSNTFTGSEITVAAALQAPTAGFTTSSNSINTGESVTFTDASTGQVDSYSWDFNGDGTEDATGLGPHSFAFNSEGTFTPTLTVTNAAGSNTFTGSTITVTNALQAPTASFTTNTTSITAGESVQFTDTSTGQVDSWFWDFGDGNTSTEQSPLHPYASAGQFEASLTVSNTAGASAPVSVTITVQATLVAPTAGFSMDTTSITVGQSVTFTDASSGTVDSYSWDFNGDGTEDATGVGPHTVPFNSEGTFTPTLTVTNTAGSNTFTGTSITVAAALQAPTAGFSTDMTSITVGQSVTFTDASSGTVDSYSWDFNGDGTEDATGVGPHTVPFNSEGTFAPTLTVTNTAGSNTFTGTSITVAAALQAPTAGFSTDTTSITVGQSVTFTDASSGTVDSYSWDFNGDGTEDATGLGPHTVPFNSEGTFTPTLTVTNTAGSNTFTGTSITVAAALQAPTAGFSTDTTSITVGQSVTFTDASSGTVDSYSWDFNGDGTEDATGVGPHTVPFNSEGTFAPTLTVTNTAGSNTFTGTSITVAAVVQTPNITGEFAFVTNRDGNNEIYVVNADGSNPVNVSQDSNDDIDPAWSPDGSQIAFSSNRFGDYDIFVLTISDGTLTQITTDTSDDTQPRWSPDGSRLAYTRTANSNSDIYLVNVIDKVRGSWVAGTANEAWASWSPDGSNIVYEADGQLFVANVDDPSTPVQITTDDTTTNYRQPTWSSTNLIAFVASDGSDNEIYTMNPDGSNIVQVTDNTANDAFPNWIPNGNRIVYSSNLATDGSGGTSNFNIYTMRADGTEQAPYTTDSSDESKGVRR